MEARPKSAQVHTRPQKHTGTRTYVLIWMVVTQAYTFAKVFQAVYLRCIHFLDVNHTSIKLLGGKGVMRSRAVEQLRLWVLELDFGLNLGSSTNCWCDLRQEIGLYFSFLIS